MYNQERKQGDVSGRLCVIIFRDMPLENNDKIKNTDMEKSIFPILVVNNSNLKPYIELFSYQPENISQQPLGSLVGFFEIRDYSEDSAYVVNFLNSVVKKEYYLNPKRSVQDSFDAALHKVNLALSELAKHGNINWLGKIDSAICVIEKNSIHFSVTGKAKILLNRNTVLTDVTEDLAPDSPDPHPLKTFTNVSSGRLEKGDKLIITSEDLFHILSLSDLKKNVARFDKDKFIQFIKTALTNELDMAGTLIVDIDEPEKKTVRKEPIKQKEETATISVFSETAFSKKKKWTAPLVEAKPETEDPEQEKEYVDKKTGHIYIQGDNEEKEDSGALQEQAQMVKEVMYNSMFATKDFFKKQAFSAWKKTKKTLSSAASYNYAGKFSSLKDGLGKKYRGRKKPDAPEMIPEESLENIIEQYEKEFQPSPRKNVSKISKLGIPVKKSVSEGIANLKPLVGKIPELLPNGHTLEKLRTVLPDASKANRLFAGFTPKQKISTVSIILALIILPLFFSKIDFKKKEAASIDTIPTTESPDQNEEKYLNERNIAFVEQVEKISSLSGVIGSFPLESDLYAVTDRTVTLIKENETKEFTWLEEYGSGRITAYMKDLNLIFILTDREKVVSFSPVSLDFKDNSIVIPQGAQISQASTYLTYLYLLDKKNNQIYRYPRAEGGFGEKTDWVKKPLDASSVSDMAIDDNVFLADKTGLRKLFRGEIVDFTMENSTTPVNFNKVHTDITAEGIYVMDIGNSRIIKFDKEGKLLKQYHNESVSDATGFSINETDKKAYIITSDEINAMNIQ
ncbi:MAG: hypothetical protein UY41_C0002G0014 [Candidatus Moranbacteria bacterium GW2011_GWE1_49_15]|nr:MAG: hypothetical protein UX75_C0003G0013 [Candidatus Moranbacteria bacterium GW2011_GWE2_47_10]KKW07497.1 MAG: hypothetical protein UY41_C0002G0014 [Candidatus Moranbacteria bacterium GW2011_GWE1_49_15]